MISLFVKEAHKYSLEEFSNIFKYDIEGKETKVELDADKIKKYIKDLQDIGILKKVKNASDGSGLDYEDILSEDIVPPAEEEKGQVYKYVFNYVGLICFKGFVLECFPKYIKKEVEKINIVDDRLQAKFKQIIKVLKKYKNSIQEVINYHNVMEQEDKKERLPIILSLLEDYYEYGLYVNDRTINEINGNGDIDWNRTINCNYPIIQNNKPYYVELVTKRRINNENDFITQLHQVMLTEISEELGDFLLDILGLDMVDLTGQRRDDLGDRNYIEYKLEQELNQEFNTRKQNVLKNLLALISNEGNLKADNSISMFGTKAFNKVWETCCKVAFRDDLPKPGARVPTLKKWDLKAPNGEDSEKTTLLDVISKPIWKVSKDCGDETEIKHKETLIPDIIRIWDTRINDKDSRVFLILDAKYYKFDFNDKKFLYGVPGIGDIDKQILYHLAYIEFLKLNGIKIVYNAFVMPTDATAPVIAGKVSAGYFAHVFKDVLVPDVEVRLVPADKIYEYYLNNEEYNITSLCLNDTFYPNRRDDEQDLM